MHGIGNKECGGFRQSGEKRTELLNDNRIIGKLVRFQIRLPAAEVQRNSLLVEQMPQSDVRILRDFGGSARPFAGVDCGEHRIALCRTVAVDKFRNAVCVTHNAPDVRFRMDFKRNDRNVLNSAHIPEFFQGNIIGHDAVAEPSRRDAETGDFKRPVMFACVVVDFLQHIRLQVSESAEYYVSCVMLLKV